MSDYAFPMETYAERGMSLRDYLAAKAMEGMCASFVNVARADISRFLKDMPTTAYEIADAMIAARYAKKATQ